MSVDIKNIKLMIRRNLGDYEHEELAIDGEVGIGSDPQEAITILRSVIEANLRPKNFNLMSEDEQKAYTSGTKKSSSKKAAPKKAAPAKKEVAEEVVEDDDIYDDEEEIKEVVETIKKSSAKATKAPATKASKFKKKNTVLDPNKELHKKLFGEAMTEVVPNWRKKEILQKKAGKIMRKLAGQDLIDSDGELLESFVDMVRAEFK